MERRVHILSRTEIFRRAIFRIDELRLQHERYDGSMSAPITRLVLNRGDSVAILLHDPARRMVVLCEQFRPPTLDHGVGWLLELPAGMVEPGEPPEACARREVVEETGYPLTRIDHVATAYLSPGGSSERVHIFHAEVSVRDDAPLTAGLAGEGEDIRVVGLEVDDAFAKAKAGEIIDAKTLVALQWLELRLRTMSR